MAFDTHKERNADNREFAENRAHIERQGALRAGTRGENTGNHPQRRNFGKVVTTQKRDSAPGRTKSVLPFDDPAREPAERIQAREMMMRDDDAARKK